MGVVDQVLAFVLQGATQRLMEAVGGKRIRVRKSGGEVELHATAAGGGLGRGRNPPSDAVRKVKGVGSHNPSPNVLKQPPKYTTPPKLRLAGLLDILKNLTHPKYVV